ncbi:MULTISPECIES: MCE family protein [unclassified Mycobacterium]|uniref:MCE family protein n=1 Tax=unclassified Mycobacterium TaxID=2642494 RepID=UPI00048CE08A|nr:MULTISPECIES: MCE family protein [unclassified Mycobacterium]SEA60478.1 phospholipid/cholesterol/gamma-HCH transport system substrate-binding protein [Mycobacterium sp. 283mftsu]
MSYRKPLIGLSLFLAFAIVVTWMVYRTLDRGISGTTNSYSATFTDVSGLHAGDDVRVAGVRVGRVDDVELDGTHAKVTFQVQKDQRLYSNTIASVTYQNIIGQRYLGLSSGTGSESRPLAAGGRIPLEHTEPSFDITYLLRGFEPLFTLLDPKQVDNLTEGIIQALQGNNGSVLSLITQTSALAQTFGGPDQVLGDLIVNLNTVVTNLASQNANLQMVITHTRDIMVGLGNRRDELRASVGSITKTVGRLATIADNVYPDLHSLVTREPGFTTQLTGDARNRIGFLGANLPAGLKALARFTQEGSYADIYACDVTSSMFKFLTTLIPAYVSGATPGNTIKHSAVCR